MIHMYDHRTDILAAKEGGSGVYFILNTINNRMRIGQSVQLFHRLVTHYGQLQAGSHTNKALQEDWTAFGEHKIEFGVLLTLPEDFFISYEERHLLDLEQHFMRLYQTKNPIYGYDFDQRPTRPAGKIYEGFFAFVSRCADDEIAKITPIVNV